MSGASASATNTTALGTGTVANAAGATAIGGNATAGAQASATDAVAIGGQSSVAAGATSGIAVGRGATVGGNYGIAEGDGATANNANDVALGSGSSTSAAVQTSSVTVGGATYAVQGTNPLSTVSVGAVNAERTVTNVAAGRVGATSTDAVNGSELYATNQAIAAAQASGLNFTDATGTNVVHENLGGTLPIIGATASAVSALSSATPTNGTYSSANVQTYANSSTGQLQIQFANNPVFTSVETGNSLLNNNGLTITGGPSLTSSGLNAANTTITNVAPGAVSKTSTDAVNGSQLYEASQQIDQLTNSVANGGVGPVQYSNPSTPTTPNGGTPTQDLTLVGATSAPVALHNVAPGVAPTDAVNMNQLGGVASALGGGAAVNPTTGAITAPSYTVNYADGTAGTVNNVNAALQAINTTGIKYFHANSTAPDSQALGQDSVAIGPNAIANDTDDVALGAGSIASAAVATPGAVINGVTYTYAGGAPIGTVSIGAPGAERTITHVAAGQVNGTSTDAINGSQLNATDQAITALATKVSSLGSTVASNLGGGAAFNDATGAVSAPNYNFSSSTGGSGNNGGGSGASAVNNVGAGLQAASNRWVTGNPATYAAPQATGANSTAVGSGAVSSGSNSVALGNHSSDGGRADVVSVGSVGAERQVTNVAAGTAATDAVNVSQLNVSIGQVNNYVSQQINGLQQDIDSTARNAYSGVAAATALTMIPDVDKDKTLALGVGSGFYHGYAAVAIGGTARVTENIKVRAGVSSSPGNGTAFGAGASMQW
nr:YadA-like family protein [Burkholderia guangdongensis]